MEGEEEKEGEKKNGKIEVKKKKMKKRDLIMEWREMKMGV